MTLLDIRERYWDNPMGAEGAPSMVPFKVIDVILRGAWKVIFRFEVENKEVFDRVAASGKAAVVAANHVSLADPPSLWVAVRPHVLRLMGKESIFTSGGQALAQLASVWGAFPVKRDSADRKAIKRAVMYLNAGEFVGIFPEGTRMRLPDMEAHYHAGTVLVARMAKVPIIPVGIRNTEKICPNGSHFPRYFQKVTAAVGEPIDPADYEHVDKKIRNEVILNDVMRAVFALRDGVSIDEVPEQIVPIPELPPKE